MSMPRYSVRFTEKARDMLRDIRDRRVRQLLLERIEQLATEPEKQGKPLRDEFGDYRSVRAVGQRYRIIFRVYAAEVVVMVVLVGRRKQDSRDDVYALAKRLLRLGVLEPQSSEDTAD